MAFFEGFINAISSQESGGNYRAVNRHSGALGRYQILPSNVGPWARQYLGMNVSPQQFLASPALQDRLAKAVLSDYVRKYGYQGAASAWYSGNPNLYNSTRSQGGYPSIKRYVDSVMERVSSSKTWRDAENAALPTVANLTAMNEVPGIETELPPAGVPSEPLGLDIEQGAGEGQLGLASPTGPESVEGAGLTTGQDEPANPLELPGFQAQDSDGPEFEPVEPTGASGSRMSPVPGFRPSGEWGRYASGGRHPALDFAVPMGTPVRAPMSGTIVSAGWESGGFGLAVRMRNADGTYTILGHLSRLSGIKPGMTVKAGQVLALSGSTGRSTGPHLHMEMRRSLYDPRTAFNFSGMFKW